MACTTDDGGPRGLMLAEKSRREPGEQSAIEAAQSKFPP